jgi:hypothetical protein
MDSCEPLDIQPSRSLAEKRLQFWSSVLRKIGYSETHGLYIKVIKMQPHVFTWGIFVKPYDH